MADRGNGRILGFDQSGNGIAQFGSRGNGSEQFAVPSAIATDADGNLWVADALGEEETAAPVAVPREGLVASFSFDQGSGGTATDSSGHGHDATISGAEWSTGKFGSALEFDAESEEDLLTVADSEDLRLEDFTLEAWVAPAEARSWAPIITKWTDGSGYALYAGGEVGGHPEGYVTFREWVDAYAFGPDELPLNRWSHLALTNDGVTLRLYVNGALVDERESVEPHAGEGELMIGGEPDAPWTQFFDGKIDEVRIYNRALSEEEVKGDRKAAIETPPSRGPVAAFSFDQGSGGSATDSSGHGHDATISGAEWTAGKFGSALEFDAGSEEDLLTVADSEDLRLEDFTLEAWVNPAEARNFAPIISKWAEGEYEAGYALYAGGEASGHPEGYVTFHEWVEAYVYGPQALPLNEWSHIAVTNDGKNLRLYVNGALVDERESIESQAGEGVLMIGGNPDVSWNEFFDGKIDEVRIYNRALSEGEVKEDQETPVFDPLEHGRIAKWSIPGYSPSAFASPNPATVDFDYSTGKLSEISLDEPQEANEPAMDVSTSSGLTTSVDAGAAGSATYSYEGGQLKSTTNPLGETKFENDPANRLKKLTLPNGTWAEVEYDPFNRVKAVIVQGAGEEQKKTQFFYRTDPRETKVWGGGNPEITYAISEAGDVVSWQYAESSPKIVGIKGSLWGHRNDPTVIENKDQTLFATAESSHEIASVKIIINGRTVVAEATCKDESTPPAHNCDQPEEPAEWVVHPAELTPGRLDIEILATDFLGHASAERFFVTVPQQPLPNPAERPRPNFKGIVKFREDYGLDRNHSLTTPQMNRLILELLFEWESQLPTAMAAVSEWGVPMRSAELDEMNFRRRYIDRAAEVIPDWVQEHGANSYGGYYVDDRAGGLIYVGFKENQQAQVESLKNDPRLINSSVIRQFPTPPSRSLADLQNLEPTVAATIGTNAEIDAETNSVQVAPEGDKVLVLSTNPAHVRSFLEANFGANAPIAVEFSAPPVSPHPVTRLPGRWLPAHPS